MWMSRGANDAPHVFMRDFTPKQGYWAYENHLDDDWVTEERFWCDNWHTRPYAAADLGFEYYQPGYRYGFEASRRHRGKPWEDIESTLRSGWERYEHRGSSEWDRVRDAVYDGWSRASGRYDQG